MFTFFTFFTFYIYIYILIHVYLLIFYYINIFNISYLSRVVRSSRHFQVVGVGQLLQHATSRCSLLREVCIVNFCAQTVSCASHRLRVHRESLWSPIRVELASRYVGDRRASDVFLRRHPVNQHGQLSCWVCGRPYCSAKSTPCLDCIPLMESLMRTLVFNSSCFS